MKNFSTSDLQESCIIDAWISRQENPEVAELYVRQYVQKSLEWASNKHIEINRIGFLNNVLECLNNIIIKEEFCVRLVSSMGFAFAEDQQTEFATKVQSNRLILQFTHFSFLTKKMFTLRYLNGQMFIYQVVMNRNTASLMNLETR